MTLIASDADQAALDELAAISSVLAEPQWRHIPSTEEVNRNFPVHRCLLVKPGRRISIAVEGSATCSFAVEVDGRPTVSLEIGVPTPRGKADLAHSVRLREWAVEACSAVLEGPRVPIPEANARMSRIGQLVVHLTGMEGDETIGGLSWSPPTPWSSARFGDALRFKPIPTALQTHLSERAMCLSHHRTAIPTTPSRAGTIAQRIAMMDVPLDREARLDMPTILRLVDELGLEPRHLEPDVPEADDTPTPGAAFAASVLKSVGRPRP